MDINEYREIINKLNIGDIITCMWQRSSEDDIIIYIGRAKKIDRIYFAVILDDLMPNAHNRVDRNDDNELYLTYNSHPFILHMEIVQQ